jgi:hypothetical protein
MLAWLRRWISGILAEPAAAAVSDPHEAIVHKALQRLDGAIARQGILSALKARWYMRDAVTFCMHTAAALERSGDARNAMKLRSRVLWTLQVLHGRDLDPPPYAALAMPVPPTYEKPRVGRLRGQA